MIGEGGSIINDRLLGAMHGEFYKILHIHGLINFSE